MVPSNCCSIEDESLPLHAHADFVNIVISPHTFSSIHNRRKMIRQRCTIKKKITKSALLLIVQILILGCRASSEHDDAVLQRQLQVQDNWIADQGGLRCTNDQEQESWMTSHKTIPDCCRSHFAWDEQKCLQNTAKWLSEATNPFFSELHQQEKFYPDTAAGICRPDSPQRPEWMSILVSSYSQCCQEHIPWDIEKCMQGSARVNDDVSASTESFYPDTAAGICKPDSPERPAWMNILVSSYSQCCQEHIPWDIENCMKGNVPVNDDVSDSSQLYYPDTTAGICKPDSPERPTWMNILVPGYRKCCEDHLAYDFEKCMNNEPEPLPQINPIYFTVTPPTSTPTLAGFYADATLRKCLRNSPNKPAWNEDLAPTHLECCRKYLDWAFKDCVADIPPTFRPTSYPIAAKDIPDPTTSPTESPHVGGFYADDVARQCLPNSADRPMWNTNIAATHLECCQKYLDWAFVECVVNIPPSLKPTRTPTIAPTPKPTKTPVTAEVSFFLSWKYSLLMIRRPCSLTVVLVSANNIFYANIKANDFADNSILEANKCSLDCADSSTD